MTAPFSEDEIRLLVERFYTQVQSDPLLAPIFASKIRGDAWISHKAHITNFWSSILLKTNTFKGNPMMKHLALSGLTPAHFDRWLALFESTAHQALPSGKAEEISTLSRRIGESLQMGMAFNYDKAGKIDHPFKKFSALQSQGREQGRGETAQTPKP